MTLCVGMSDEVCGFTDAPEAADSGSKVWKAVHNKGFSQTQDVCAVTPIS